MAVRVYHLDIETIDGTEKIKGSQYIKNALVEVEGTQRKVVIDTDTKTHNALKALATSSRTAYPEEQRRLASFDFTTPPPSPLEQKVADLETRLAAVESK